MGKCILGDKKILIVGFGSIGAAVLPIIFDCFEDVTSDKIAILTADASNAAVAEKYRVSHQITPLTPENYSTLLDDLLNEGDVLLNLSVDVSSYDLLIFCQARGIYYLDTSSETWLHEKDAPAETWENCGERRIRILERKQDFVGKATAVICHGANPGIVSHFVKQALLNLAAQQGIQDKPKSSEGWARLAKNLKVQTIHIAERDTQTATLSRSSNEFVNTWSPNGFMFEAAEFSNFAWGTHEAALPAPNTRKLSDNLSPYCQMIELNIISAQARAKSWVPSVGDIHGYVIPHAESFSIAELLTLRDREANNRIVYQPTVHYVYQPSVLAVASLQDFIANKQRFLERKKLLMEEIEGGIDELGVLILREGCEECYWYGSQLSIEEARLLVPHNNATSLQVAAGVVGGLIWALQNPYAGLVEADNIDFEMVLEIARPYLGTVKGVTGKMANSGTGDEVNWHFKDLMLSS
ncbi:MAG: saccharopine dehydrogenase NADP-binding domain-containing protein [Gammaproteobacteria bacterium]